MAAARVLEANAVLFFSDVMFPTCVYSLLTLILKAKCFLCFCSTLFLKFLLGFVFVLKEIIHQGCIHLIVKAYIMPQQISISNTFALFHAEASAKTRDGVQCAFEELVEKILQTPGLWESVHKTRGVALSELSETGQGGCGAYCSLL